MLMVCSARSKIFSRKLHLFVASSLATAFYSKFTGSHFHRYFRPSVILRELAISYHIYNFLLYALFSRLFISRTYILIMIIYYNKSFIRYAVYRNYFYMNSKHNYVPTSNNSIEKRNENIIDLLGCARKA